MRERGPSSREPRIAANPPAARHVAEEGSAPPPGADPPAGGPTPSPRTKGAARAPSSLIAGRYRMEQNLGRGGMGIVYRVVDTATGQMLALKQLGGAADTLDSEWRALRFRREFHIMARLVHPRIVKVYDFGLHRPESSDTGELPFYTMELLDGSDLKDLGRQDPKQACRLLRDVASALTFLHARRLIHRDLAPRNVRCTADGRAKLIDFGVLATVGACGDVSGTPPFVAPENVRGLPLDHRADLYGLGALGYWMLTGEYAYPARSIDHLEEAYRTPPAPLRSLAPEVPTALEELVMSLVSLDPLARPGAAVEVIDRLGAIAGLEPLELAALDRNEARSYVASATLVGRQRELDSLRHRVQRAHGGQGGAALLEAPSGGGKSRLLRELGLEAQVTGATVITAGGEAAGKGPYGVLRTLARALLLAAADDAVHAALPSARVIARVIPELRERLGPLVLAPPLGDGGEERVRLQMALTEWFVDVATRRTLVILVDDVQRSDEASAAVLASLAHSATDRRMFVASALRLDEPARAPAAVAALRDAGTRLRLRGLGLADIEELARGLFGDVTHLARLARWLLKAGGGSPMYTIELIRHLIERDIIRYEGGMWSVPEEPRLDRMPDDLSHALELRIASLSANARRLAEALSIHDGWLPLDLCVLLADSPQPDEVFAALDELVDEEVLIGATHCYQFRHDAVREALLRGVDAERTRKLHLRIAEALASQGAIGPEREAEIGWHFVRGGETGRGGDLLARAGKGLYEAQSFSDAALPLEAALGIYEADKRPLGEVLELRIMILMAGAMSNRSAALRYADETIAAYRRLSGMAVVSALTRYVGSHIALAAGIVYATLGWLFSWPRRPGPVASLRSFYVAVGYAASTRSLSLDVEPLRALLELVEPLRAFRTRVIGGACYFTETFLAMALGWFTDVRKNCDHILDILERDRLTPFAEMDRKNAEGSALYMLAMLRALDQDPAYESEVARLQAIKMQFFDVCGDICRLVFHRLRGEEDEAAAIEARTELRSVQLGSLWGPEATIHWVSTLAYGFTRDVLGLRRRIEELVRLVGAGFHLEANLELARGEYLRERGELGASHASLEKALALLPRDELFIFPAILTALAETHLATGELEQAVQRAGEALRIASRGGLERPTWVYRGERVIALAEAAAGDLAAAAERLDRAIAGAAPLGSPSISGSLHEARVRVATMAGDHLSYEVGRREVERWYRATKNPALISRLDRLPAPPRYQPKSQPPSRDDQSASEIVTGAVTMPAAASAPNSGALLTGCCGSAERATRALELLVVASSAASGYLYLFHEGGRIELAAPLSGDEPPGEIAVGVKQRAEELVETISDEMTEVDHGAPDESAERLRWRPVALRMSGAGRSLSVGMAALVCGGLPLEIPRSALIEELARELYEAGDVTGARR